MLLSRAFNMESFKLEGTKRDKDIKLKAKKSARIFFDFAAFKPAECRIICNGEISNRHPLDIQLRFLLWNHFSNLAPIDFSIINSKYKKSFHFYSQRIRNLMFGLLLALSNFVLVVSGMLSVSCGVGICQGKCGINACIKYQVPTVNYKFQKCMASTECTGVSAGNYDLFKCSGIPDTSGQMSCSNQCCYFHSESRKNVCLAPTAIGLIDSEYDNTCAAASRNLFKEITDLTNLLAVMQLNFEKLRKADQTQMLKKKQQLQKEMMELKNLIKSIVNDEKTQKIHGVSQVKKLGKSFQKKMSVLNQKINQSPPPSNPMTPGTIIAIASLVVTVILFVVQHFCLKIKMNDSIKKLDEKLSQQLSQNQKRIEDNISEKINPKRLMRQHIQFSRQNIAGREEKSEKVSQQ